ncbi:MAG: hypothetical protein HY078_06065 [Elusimicrobia bacterium]|nr:hypothetical protein [Elusimicrobiota bacterium]
MAQHRPDPLEREIARLEEKFREATDELRHLRENFKLSRAAHAAEKEIKAEIAEIKDEWEAVHYRWWIIVLAGVLTFFVVAYFYYTQIGWYADHRRLPPSSDWLLNHLPVPKWDLLPILSWGWLALHLYAAAICILYYPRQLPFILFTLALFILVRSTFIFLSPIGAPHGMMDMSKLDYFFRRAMGWVTFNNEFVFSGHTSVPFLFYLFFETPWQRRFFLTGSILMAATVLLTRNHYSVDVMGAYLITYSIFVLSRRLYFDYIRPLFLLEHR